MNRIPTPVSCENPSVSVTTGKAKYVGAENAIIWKIPKFVGMKEYKMTGEVGSRAGKWIKPPITMEFEVVMYTASGLFVKFLKVLDEDGGASVKWVKYVSVAGSYQIQLNNI
jgi:AP-2 complex subunit mu-1